MGLVRDEHSSPRREVPAITRHVIFAIAALAACATTAAAEPPDSVFHIDRNKNRNQVHYGVHLDDHCHPVGSEPMYNYWLRREESPPEVKDLSFFQQTAYGFQKQEIEADGRIEVRLRAIPERLIVVRVTSVRGACKAETFMTIDGKQAYLDKVFVFAEEGVLLPTVRYIELTATARDVRYTRRSPWTIDSWLRNLRFERYLLGEVARAFLAAVGLAVSVLFVLRLVEFVDLAFARGVPARLVGRWPATSFRPISRSRCRWQPCLRSSSCSRGSAATASCWRCGRPGINLNQLARPLVAFSVAVALVSLVLGVWARPWANRGIESTTYDMARTRLTASFRAGVFNTWFGGVILFVDELDPSTGSMRNVMLAEEREEYGRKSIFASDGHVESNENARTAYLQLRNGSLLTYHPSGKYHDKTDFDSLELHLDLAEERGIDLMDNGGPSAMSMSRLLEERSARLARGESAIEETIELHRKFVLPAAALLLPFIGVPLGGVGRRGVKSRGLLLSSIVILLYYLALSGAVTVAREQILPVGVAMWLPDVLLATLAALLFARASAERSLRPVAAAVARMNLLGRYIVGLYLRSFLLCLVGAIGLLLVVEFFTRIGDFASYNSNPTLVATYFLLKTPKWLVEVIRPLRFWPCCSASARSCARTKSSRCTPAESALRRSAFRCSARPFFSAWPRWRGTKWSCLPRPAARARSRTSTSRAWTAAACSTRRRCGCRCPRASSTSITSTPPTTCSKASPCTGSTSISA